MMHIEEDQRHARFVCDTCRIQSAPIAVTGRLLNEREFQVSVARIFDFRIERGSTFCGAHRTRLVAS
jgi:hypothetical protein